MSVAEAIREASTRLSQTSDTARLDAELLMAHALGVSRSELLLRSMQANVPEGFERLITRRASHEPVAYIIGRAEFYGREFLVNPDVLIPRPDSETIIETALEALGDAETATLLDLGTGSGALLLTLLTERTGFSGIGLDSSDAALQVAQSNADRLGLSDRAKFMNRDWTNAGTGPEAWPGGLPQVDLIVANPPYVETSADLSPDVRDFEPAGALFAGSDGLDDYRILIPTLHALLKPGGVAVLEIGASQGPAVCDLGKSSGFNPQLHLDLANRPRAVVLR